MKRRKKKGGKKKSSNPVMPVWRRTEGPLVVVPESFISKPRVSENDRQTSRAHAGCPPHGLDERVITRKKKKREKNK